MFPENQLTPHAPSAYALKTTQQTVKIKDDYRIDGPSVAGLKGEDYRMALIKDAWQAWGLCPEPKREQLLARLTPGQRAVLFLSSLELQIKGDGFSGYLSNSGEELPTVIKALRLIGDRNYLPLCQRAARFSANQSVLINRAARRAALKRISVDDIDKRLDDPVNKLNEKKETSLLTLLLTYAKRHPADFFLPSEQVAQNKTLAAGSREYRVSGERVCKLRGEALHWELIAEVWDDYHDALRKNRSDILDFLAKLSRGQRALVAIDILGKGILHLGGFYESLHQYCCPDSFTTYAWQVR